MTAVLPTDLMPPLKAIAVQAGEAILAVYHSGQTLEIHSKSDDSPVTAADLAAHRIIVAGLQSLTPDIPILSEEDVEGLTWPVRQSWQSYWLVDPLDGTKEFINRTGEFTVNIALIQDHQVAAGVVYLPEKNTLYHAVRDGGAFKEVAQDTAQLQASSLNLTQPISVVASRRHGTETLERMLTAVQTTLGDIHKVCMGSSLKICALAEGKADWYPRLAPTSEWDTAAAQIILEEAGGILVDTDFRPVRYNTKESLLNPHFHAFADPVYPWADVLKGVS